MRRREWSGHVESADADLSLTRTLGSAAESITDMGRPVGFFRVSRRPSNPRHVSVACSAAIAVSIGGDEATANGHCASMLAESLAPAASSMIACDRLDDVQARLGVAARGARGV